MCVGDNTSEYESNKLITHEDAVLNDLIFYVISIFLMSRTLLLPKFTCRLLDCKRDEDVHSSPQF